MHMKFTLATSLKTLATKQQQHSKDPQYSRIMAPNFAQKKKKKSINIVYLVYNHPCEN